MDAILNGLAGNKEKRSRSNPRNSTLDRIKNEQELSIASTMKNVEINKRKEM